MLLGKQEKAHYMEALKWLLINAVKRRFDCFYKYTPQYKQEERYTKILDVLTDSAITNRRGKAENLKFIDHLLRISEQERNYKRPTKDLHPCGCGHHCRMIQFTVFELGKHPEIQAKILEETNSILGEKGNDDFSYSNLEGLRYTEAICNEALRMYAPVHFLERKLTKSTILGPHTMLVGTTVPVFVSALQNSQLHFPEPKRFKPERFMSENAGSIPAHSFIPFGYGPRICLGKKFAITEAKLMLAKIVRNFELRPVQPEHKLILSMAGTLKSDDGFPIQIRKMKAKEDNWKLDRCEGEKKDSYHHVK